MPNKPCPKCQEPMVYNNHYHCYNCGSCDSTYNAALQELRPVHEWSEEYDNEN